MILINLINKKVVAGKRRMFFQVKSENEILPAGELLIEISFGRITLFNCKIQLAEMKADSFKTFFADLPVMQWNLGKNITWAWKPAGESKIRPKIGKCILSTKFENLYVNAQRTI